MKRILAVDDNLQTLQIIRHTLERAGFDVSTAASGPDALNLIQLEGLPHLALVDFNIPGMDGLALCRAIRQLGDVPIIMLTAIDGADKMSWEGSEDYMGKPFRPSELVARVQALLDHHASKTSV